MSEMNYEAVIESFHLMWDGFPGPARLIDRRNKILAANQSAVEAGFKPGLICATVGTPESHKGCKKFKVLKDELAQIDRPSENRIRGWLPVEGYPDIVVHFSLTLPATNG